MAGALTAAIAAAFAGTAAPSSDPYFEYTTLLLPGNGTNGAQNNTFLDGSTNNFTITRNGNTTQGTFSPFSQTGWGNYFDGTGDYLEIADNTAFNLSGGVWTIEAWINPNGNYSNYRSIINKRVNASASCAYLLGLNTSTGELIYYNGTIYNSTVTPTANVWSHVAAVYDGTNINLYLNGNRVLQSATGNTNVAANVRIGSYPSYNEDFFGYISNLRVVKGGALYSGTTYAVPTAPLTTTVSSGTVSLLTCQSNRFIDNSSNNFTITRNGNASVVAFSPFNPSASWSAATNGGSGYFDGTGDYLNGIGTTSSFNFMHNSSSLFTFEAWLFRTATGGATQILFTNSDQTSSNIGVAISIESGVPLLYITRGVAASVVVSASAATAIPVGAWSYIAVTYDQSLGSNNAKWYVNGTLDSQTSKTANAPSGSNATNAASVGGNSTGTSPFTGYISNIRISNVIRTISTPTTPYTNDANTSLLLNFTNAGIYDATSKNDLETVGNAQISNTTAKFGSTSMYFDGTGDWLLIPDQPPQRIGTGNFTIEMWVYRNSSGTYGLAGKGTGTTGWLVSLNSSNQVVFTYGSSTITSSGTVSATTWTHIAVVREGTSTNQTKIYIGGSNDGTGTVSTDFNQTNSMYIGADRTGGSAANAYVQDVRITNYARYTANFTAPTAAFPTL